MASPAPRPAPRSATARRSAPLPPDLRGFLFTLLAAGLLAGIEWGARLLRSDAEEVLAVVALLLLADLVRRRHRRVELPWVAALAALRRRVEGAVRRQFVTVGIDLRRDPPVPEAFPPLLGRVVLALAVVPVVLLAFPGLDALALRAALRPLSATLWVALLGATWALFLVGGFYLLFLTFALTHDELVRAHAAPGPRPRWRESLAFAAWPVLLLGAWNFLPSWAPLAVHAGCLAIAAAVLSLPGGPDVPLLWKLRADGAPVRAVPWRIHTLAGTAAVALLLADTLLLVRGAGLRGGADVPLRETLPLTALLASLFAWNGAAALVAWTHLVVRTAMLARFRDPARPTAAPVLVDPPPSGDERERWRGTLRDAGFRPRFGPGAVRGGEVLHAPADGDPGDPSVLRRLRRRGELASRRRLLRGLEGLFKRAAGRRFQQGHGFWVAPWHWFCVGLSRDEDERAMDWKEGTFFLETVGPAYHRVFPRPVLRHAHEVMQGLEVDLLFVEDGVGFRRLRRVLRMAFELHDMFGGRGRAEEHHFTGLPGVRVMIHSFDMEEPLRARREGYPEPDYESVGRARILHVFRDRGEAEETVDAPRDRSGVPVPA